MQLGLYSDPKNLTLNVQMVINPIVTNVGLPVMAKAQGDAALLKRVYLQTMRMTASVKFPIYVAIAFFAPEIVHRMLGEKWKEAIPLLQIFACWGLLRSIGNPAGSLLFATGKAKLAFKWNMVPLFFIGPTIWIGSQYGAQGMAISMTGLMAILFVPGWYVLIRPSCGATLGEYLIQLFVPLGKLCKTLTFVWQV
jgi:O-antigen/teichoic acid export membrane protein